MTPAPKCPNCGREMEWCHLTWFCGSCAVPSTASDHTAPNGLFGIGLLAGEGFDPEAFFQEIATAFFDECDRQAQAREDWKRRN